MNEMITEQIPVDELGPNCYKTVQEEVKHVFSEDEVKDLKNDLFELMRTSLNRTEVLAGVKAILDLDDVIDLDEIMTVLANRELGKIGIKTSKKNLKLLTLKITKGYEITMQTLYCFDYQEIRRMAMYDKYGLYVYDRPLHPEEYQSKIKTINKTA